LLPNLIETPGIFYFKTRRKIDLFGICNEGAKLQANFLIDEGCKIGKGPNSVISMLNHYLMKNIPKDASIILYANNCSGQNKNQTVVGYLTYLVKVLRYYKRIELYFMLSGHTNFSPDGHFGRIKSCINQNNCFSIVDLVGSEGKIQKSSIFNYEIFYKDPLTSTVNFLWRDWKQFIKERFMSCPGIRDWHCIKIDQEGDEIQVSNFIDKPLRNIKIMTNFAFSQGEP